jgi:hypothetical protein
MMTTIIHIDCICVFARVYRRCSKDRGQNGGKDRNNRCCASTVYGTVIRCRTVFLQFRTIYTVQYGTVYGTVQKLENWLFLHVRPLWLIFTKHRCRDSLISNVKLKCKQKTRVKKQQTQNSDPELNPGPLFPCKEAKYGQPCLYGLGLLLC